MSQMMEMLTRMDIKMDITQEEMKEMKASIDSLNESFSGLKEEAVPHGLQMMAQCRLCGLSSSHGQAVPDGLQMMAQCRLCGLSLICMARQFLMEPCGLS
ncbi:hypothetical protein ACOMHN_007285 [Nucella lapillus]